MIQIQMNGQGITCQNSQSLEELLKEQQFREEYIVVELNNEIVPKDCYATTKLKNHDQLEVVSFVGGG